VRAEENAYYVNKLRQNVGLETWIWRQIVTSQTGHTKYKWAQHATEWKPLHENFLRTPLKRAYVQLIKSTTRRYFQKRQHDSAWKCIYPKNKPTRNTRNHGSFTKRTPEPHEGATNSKQRSYYHLFLRVM